MERTNAAPPNGVDAQDSPKIRGASSTGTRICAVNITGAVLVALVPLATIALSESAALLSEMTALQHRHATHVAPVMFTAQILVPVLLAPLIFGESWASTPFGGAALVLSMAVAVAGTALLAGSRAVGAIIETARDGP
jgi:membrane-bound metal-dependent hydrolase YbcI (DUF457 family)